MTRRDDLTAPRLPRGFADRGQAELAATRAMTDAIRETYELWGFEALETPFFEYTDALGKFLPDQDRPNAGVFSLKDDDDQWMSLRYDLTAPLARHVAENFQKLAKPYRSYRFGPVFRNEKPGPGRFRQFLQFDADIVGAKDVSADAEMCMMMADTLEAVGIKRGDYVVRVNNRKILDGLMEAIGLGGEENAGKRLTVLRAIDKRDRLGAEGVRALLTSGRKDESGDFTKGAGLSEINAQTVLDAFDPNRSPNVRFGVVNGRTTVISDMPDERYENWAEVLEGWNNSGIISVSGPPSANPSLQNIMFLQSIIGDSDIGYQGIGEILTIMRFVREAGYGEVQIEIGAPVVRGLEYYTGPVFEAELTFTVHDDEGRPIQFGSVGGGGRYDGLVGRFMAEDVPATGFSIGVSRLQAALKALEGEEAKATGPVVVLVLDREHIGASMALAARLRAEKIAAEVYLGSSGMKAQMKYADRRKSPCVVIQGSDEREKGEVTLKDLVAGAKAAAGITERAEWTESRPAQVTVAEDRLVEEVQAILARHE